MTFFDLDNLNIHGNNKSKLTLLKTCDKSVLIINLSSDPQEN